MVVIEQVSGVGLVAAFHEGSSSLVRGLFPAGVATMPVAVAAEALSLSPSLFLSSVSRRLSVFLSLFFSFFVSSLFLCF